MGRAGQIAVAALLGTLLPYSLGLGFLDAFPLALYGVWAMILTRERTWRQALVEVVILVTWGFLVVWWRSQTPRLLTPSWPLCLALTGWFAALAQLGERYPRRWLPWLAAALLYYLPGEYFVYQYIAVGALAVLTLANLHRFRTRLLP